MRTLLLSGLLILPLLMACSSDSNQVTHVESEVREAIKSQISERYQDPGSTRFRVSELASYDPDTGKFVKEFMPRANSYMLCGEVSGRNRFGSSTGYKRFAALYMAALDEGEDPEIDVMYEGNHIFDSFAEDCP